MSYVLCLWLLGAYSPVCAPGAVCVRCQWPLMACSPVHAPRVLWVRCLWPVGACSPLCAPSVLCVRCPWPLGACSLVCLLGVLCVRCPLQLCACSPVCARGLLCVRFSCPLSACLAELRGRCVVCAMSLASWRLFTAVCAWSAVCAVSLASPLLCVGGLCVVLRCVALLAVRCLLQCTWRAARATLLFLVCLLRGGCVSLMSGLVPWLLPAAHLYGVCPSSVLVRHASFGPVAIGAPVGFAVAVVPSHTRDSRPCTYWAAAGRTWRQAKDRAHGACRWPPPRVAR